MKGSTIAAIVVVGAVAVLAFVFLGGGSMPISLGGGGGQSPSLGGGSSQSPSTSGTVSSGAGGYSAFESITYSPQYDYRYQYSPSTSTTNVTQTQVGLLNFRSPTVGNVK